MTEEDTNKASIPSVVLARQIKELGCLYGIEKLVSSEGESVEVVLQSVARILPQSLPQPELICARIQFGGHAYCSEPFAANHPVFDCVIRVQGERVGQLELFLTDSRVPEGFRLSEADGDLLMMIAHRLGQFIERWQTGEELRTQFRSLPVPTFTWKKHDADFVLKNCNDAALTLTGERAGGCFGWMASAVYADAPLILAALELCARQKKEIRQETWFTFKTTNEKKYLSVTCVPVPPDMVMMHAEDITERFHAEKMREAVLTVSAELAGCQSPDEACRMVVEGIREQMDIDRCGLFLKDPDSGAFKGTYGTDLQGRTTDEHDRVWDIRKERQVEDIFLGVPYKTGFPLGNPDTRPGEELLSTTLIALKRFGAVFGVISVDNRMRRTNVSESKMYHISLLAEVLGNALQAAGTRLELQQAMTKLKSANEELEAFNRAMVGREARMIELKEEINRLLTESNRTPRYPPVWEQAASELQSEGGA